MLDVRVATVAFHGIAPLSQSREHSTEKLPKEGAEAYEERTWINRAHVTKDGRVFVPAMAFKFSLANAVKRMGTTVPGKGKATYTKFFDSGVIVTEDVIVGNKEDIRRQRVFANADGVRGSGKRVWRSFPTLDEWGGTVVFQITLADIPAELFEQAVKYCGLFNGVGQFRPQNGGTNGRFAIDSVEWGTM